MLARPAALESWLQHFDAMKDTHLCLVDSFDPLAAADPGLALSCSAAIEQRLKAVAGKDELSYVAKYVDGKQCLVMQRDTASERAGAAAVATAIEQDKE